MIIKRSRGKTFLYIIGSVIITALCVVMSMINFSDAPTFLVIIIKVVGIVGALFFVYGTVYFISAFIKNESLIEVTDEYLYDNSSAIAVKKILYEDIEEIGIKGGFICIKVKNPEEYLERLGPIAKFLTKTNIRLGYETITINPGVFKTNVDIKKFLDMVILKLTENNPPHPETLSE